MKIFTSYFYKIRFFKPWQIPISTACSDPKWFHNFKDKKHIFVDKNGILNGLRAEKLHPDSSCHDLCHGREGCEFKPESCAFLQAYRKQLEDIDLVAFYQELHKVEELAKKHLNLNSEHEIEIVLIVHEAKSNACSERAALQEIFNCTELQL